MMALTPAEKQKRYRERQKLAQKAAPDLTMNFVKGKLSEFNNANRRGIFEFEFVENAMPIGLDFPDDFFGERHTYEVGGLVGANNSMSGRPLLERMEALAGFFLDAATELHATINEFKLAEIDARIAEIEQSDLSDTKAKAKALQDIVIFQGIKASLEGKTFRRSFAEIRVKGSTSN